MRYKFNNEEGKEMLRTILTAIRSILWEFARRLLGAACAA